MLVKKAPQEVRPNQIEGTRGQVGKVTRGDGERQRYTDGTQCRPYPRQNLKLKSDGLSGVWRNSMLIGERAAGVSCPYQKNGGDMGRGKRHKEPKT